jgi:hypothetical protein
MNHALIRISLLLLAGFSLGCGGGDDPPTAPLVDCNTVTAKKYSELTIWGKCTSCHASTLTGAAHDGSGGHQLRHLPGGRDEGGHGCQPGQVHADAARHRAPAHRRGTGRADSLGNLRAAELGRVANWRNA